jgi:hypothetical protein
LLTLCIPFGCTKGELRVNNLRIRFEYDGLVIIPIRYKENLFASSKIGNDYYANFIFYNFVTDSSKSLFKDNSFIREFGNVNNYYYRHDKIDMKNNMSSKWIFYFVKEDYNKNGRIDYKNPSVLYVSDKQGNGLKSISPEDKNAISFVFFNTSKIKI